MPSKPSIPRICEYCKRPFLTLKFDIKRGTGRFCSHSCAGHFYSTPANPEDRFWGYVDQTNDCWLWRGGKTTDGYGAFNRGNNRRVVAHRFSYELAYGPIPDGLLVCHKCDVRHCVRPDHLFLGTHADNNHDMAAKGRARDSAGAANPNAKLTPDDVRNIRQLAKSGANRKELAAHYGISNTTLGRITRRKNWKHV